MTSKELKKWRMDLGYFQVEMAKFLHTPYRTYQDRERGVRPIPGTYKIINVLERKYKTARSIIRRIA